MGYNLGVCPQCNNVMSMPDDSEIVRCPTCQSEVSAREAAALAGATGQNGIQQQPAMPYNAPANFNAPLLSTWKTDVLFTILGVVAAMVINGFAGASSSDASSSMGTMAGIFSLIYVIFSIVYAAKIYPSYFTDKPMISSSAAISFLNTFVGGIIFGLIWNHNLTRKEKGIAHIVFIVLIIAAFVLVFLAVFMLATQYVS